MSQLPIMRLGHDVCVCVCVGGGGQAQKILNMEYSFYFKILKLSLNIKKCEHCKCPNYETFYINGSRMGEWRGGGVGCRIFFKIWNLL